MDAGGKESKAHSLELGELGHLLALLVVLVEVVVESVVRGRLVVGLRGAFKGRGGRERVF